MLFEAVLVIKGYEETQTDPGKDAMMWAVGMGGKLDPEYVSYRVANISGPQVTLHMKLDFPSYSAFANKLNTWFSDPFFGNLHDSGYPPGTLLWWGTKGSTNGIGGPRVAVIPGDMA